jgi:hypothetical protein
MKRLSLLLALAGCSKESSQPAPLPPAQTETTPSIRMRVHTEAFGSFRLAGHEPPREIPETKGGGLALFDFDRDGDLDLFVPNGATLETPRRGPGAKLFLNQGNLRFEDAGARVAIDFAGWGMGVAVADIDADGWDDLYIAALGKDALLRNEKGLRLRDITVPAGLTNPRWGTAAAFGDLDGDLDLDLFLVQYLDFDPAQPPPRERYRGIEVFGGPLSLKPEPDAVFENLGNLRFLERTETSGLLDASPGLGLGCVILDFNGDGRQDIFVGNDSTPKQLYLNMGDWRLEERALPLGLAVNADGAAQATMGIAIADINNDQRPDIFTTNFADDTNLLQVSRASDWEDRTRQYKLGAISRPFLGWAAHFADLDLDGDEDLLIFNGHVYAQATAATMNSEYRQPALCFERRAEAFERVQADWLAPAHVDRSAVFGDLDGDGDIDAIVAEQHGPLRLYENLAPPGNWLQVELLDERPQSKNRRGLGARIEVLQGKRSQTRWIYSGGSYQAANPEVAHLGFASADPVRVRVHWPDGALSDLAQVPLRHKLRITHP